ncbi:MAG: BamA/TamA family outer membrane protein [Bacteroidota bacterium]
MKFYPHLNHLCRLLLLGLWLSSGWNLAATPDTSLTVKTILFSGNKKTKGWILLREMTLKEGDVVSLASLQAELEQSRKNIYNLDLFNQVQLRHSLIPGGILIEVGVQERWYIFGTPNVGLEERNSYDFVGALRARNLERLVYGGTVQWRNVTGRNETLFIRAQAGFSRRLWVEFIRPALWRKANIDFRAGVNLTAQKSVILGTEAGRVQWRGLVDIPLQRHARVFSGLTKRFGLYKRLYAELSWRQYTLPADSLAAFPLFDEPARYISQPDGLERFAGLVVQFLEDRRDLRAFPWQGYKYQVLGRLGGGPGSTTRFAKLGASWAHHLPFGRRRRWNFSYGFSQVYTFGSGVPFPEKTVLGIGRREFLGLSRELRGFEPYAIDGTWLSLNKAALSFAIIPRKIIRIPYVPFAVFQNMPIGLYLSAHTDHAYVQDNSFNNLDQFLKNRHLVGYGIGLNVISFYDLLLRIEFTRNNLGENGLYFNTTVPIK